MNRNPDVRSERVDLLLSVLNGGAIVLTAAVGASNRIHPLLVAMVTATGLAVFARAPVRYARARRGDRVD
ncbi:hypothetical protein [Saccharopolyspora mangrovi]|uniref:Uncharacterized protein n=1 Tax=Saccharopolyspora mangrovi TaxID=3082379 RepID=A0ABU6AA30_9PSEU|nr:hypothetical protein [Saccharopolyspora sp. S2-29]MEB3368351.1 hypothetical protein [Saccharopolyspora sp. S2-29]